jgi:hypothetical protein
MTRAARTVSKGQSNLVTIIGEAYFQPIADLVDGWLRRPPSAPNKVQSNFYEHGYAAAVVLLLVAMFESYVSRLLYLSCAKVPKNAHAIQVVREIIPRLRHKKALEDVYVLRDVLIHNHLLEIDYEGGGSPLMVLKEARKHPAYGNRRYEARVNVAKLRTKALGLSVNPIRVNRRDVLAVFDIIWKTLLSFEAKYPSRFAVSYQRVRFRGDSTLFHELRDQLKTARYS